MSDTRDEKQQEAPQQDVIIGGETRLDEKGQILSSVSKVTVTDDLLQSVLNRKNIAQLKDPQGSYRTTEELTAALIEKTPESSVEHTPGILGAQQHGKADDRPFIGVNLEGKVKPRDMPEQGKDPVGLRMFIGDEFPRMLAYGPPKVEQGYVTDPETGERKMTTVLSEEAKPAFYSHWPEGTALEDMKTIKVNIATKVPDYMQKGTIAASMAARSADSFRGQSLEEAFSPITDKVEKAWRRFAKDYEKTFGIKLDIRRDDSDEPHPDEEVNISVCGFARGHPQLAGFANFPDAITQWGGGLQALGHKQGFMMLNHEYTNSPLVSDAMVYDLVEHEFGHFMGMVHPHDLGNMRMTQEEALNNTVMAYTDGKFSRFEGEEGIICGPVDLGLRKYLANAPEINTDHGTVYDLEEQYKKSLGENADSKVMAMTKMMPSIPIVNNGTGTVLRGSTNNDVIDTEPGHVSFRSNPLGIRQGYALVEGHISKILGRAGNNHIFLSSKGSQEVHPGPGSNNIHIYSPDIGDNKVIHSQGKDQLAIHQDVFIANPNLEVEQDGKDIILRGDKGAIILKDQLERSKGIASVAVLNDEGRTVMQQDVRHFTVKGFGTDLIQPMKRHVRRIEAEEKAAAKHQPGAGNLHHDFEETLPEIHHDCGAEKQAAVHNDNAVDTPAETKGNGTHVSKLLEKMRQQEEEKQKGGSAPGL